MSLKAKIEAIIYAAEEPITVEQISSLVKDLVVAEQAQALAVSLQPEQSSDYVQPEAATEPAAETAEAESTEPAAEVAPVEAPVADGEGATAEPSAAVEAPEDTAPKKK